jgi:hypothetical protein
MGFRRSWQTSGQGHIGAAPLGIPPRPGMRSGFLHLNFERTDDYFLSGRKGICNGISGRSEGHNISGRADSLFPEITDVPCAQDLAVAALAIIIHRIRISNSDRHNGCLEVSHGSGQPLQYDIDTA